MPTDPNKTEPGICGCGIPDVDQDNDSYLVCQDCNDTNPDVNPGQTSYFANPYGIIGAGEWDYNCNGVEELRWTELSYCDPNTMEQPDGWYYDTVVPACGDSGTYYLSSNRPCDNGDYFSLTQQCK